MIRLAALICLFAAPLAAHPHIFVNAGIDVVVDEEGRLTHLRITWEYDELYSLLITEEYSVDQDFDGVLNAADLKTLTGFDMNWIEGFNGDLEANLAGEPLILSGPGEATADLTDGRIVTTHLRAVEGAPLIAGKMLSLKPYDITYYTAYDVSLPVTLSGREGCQIAKQLPDIDAALAQTQEELAKLSADADVEAAGFPEIGARFATEIEISCPGGS